MLFDTHAHYDDSRFDDDRDAVLSQMQASGVSLILNAGSTLATSMTSLALADKHPFIYAAVGVHPHDAKELDDNSLARLSAMAAHPKAVAIGEIGLDYHYDHSPRDVQRARFREQLELAEHVGLPVVIHEREATRDTLDVLAEVPRVNGVFHSYSGSWETAKPLVDKGWYFSFSGVITFKNARRSHEVIENLPRDRLMIETDCPYLAPVPMRGRRNSSLYLKYTAEKMAELLGIPFEAVAELTRENGCRRFGIDV